MKIKHIIELVRHQSIILIVFSGAIFSVSAGDLLLTCSTPKGDTYEDGTPVSDGECYALVHTAEGATFQGFTADGRAIDPAKSYVALAAGLAKGGRCPPTLSQVLEANAATRTNGVWELFLLDTRAADGQPSGMDANGRLTRVNAWRRVNGRIRAKRGPLVSASAFEEVPADTSAAQLPSGVGVLPANAPQPRITGIRMVDGGVELTVSDTVPYLTYDIDGAAKLQDFGRRSRRVARRAQDGRANGVIRFEVPSYENADAGEARFFKVVRK